MLTEVKRLFTLFCLMLSLLTTLVYAQTISNLNSSAPPSSQGLSLGEISNITNHVDKYTGRLNYGIKLLNVPMAGINIPLSVNYSTTGFRVQEMPGVNGLGWGNSLNAMITRAVEGLPDENFYGYCGPNRTGEQNYSPFSKDYFEKTTKSEWDSQPDKFFFSFMGFSGSFVLDPDGKPILLSASQGIQILTCPFIRINGAMGGKWVLRDQQGNQYIFGDGAYESTTNYCHGEKQNQYQSYTSGWYLKKIITSTNKEINFTYVNYSSVSYSTYVNMKRSVSGNGTCSGNSAASWNENIDATITPAFLTKISYDKTSVDLEYNHNRLDLTNGKALTSIRVSQNGNETVAYQFNYGYFGSSDGTQAKRLKLQNITESHLGVVNKMLYAFYYNEQTNLPARNSVKTDYWGYYNNNTTGSNLIGEADKNPDYANTKANVLERVTNALGGSTYFEYQLNSFTSGNQTTNIGGLRLSRTYDKSSEADQTLYNQAIYDYTQPGSSLSSGQSFSNYGSNYYFQVTWFCDNAKAQYETYRSSEPLSALYNANGSTVGYSYVTVKAADNSSVRYHFTNYSDYPDEFEHGFFNSSSGSTTVLPGTISGMPTTSMAFARGQLLSEELLDNNNSVVKSTQYLYSLGPRTGNVIGVRPVLELYFNQGQWNQYRYSKYKYFTQDLRLVHKTEKYRKGGNDQQTLSETYTYTDYAPNLIRTLYRSNGSEKIERYTFRYPFDMVPYLPTNAPGAGLPMTFMTYNNIISTPVETVHSIVRDEIGKVVDVRLTKYRPFSNGNLLPYREEKLETNVPFPESGYVPYSVYYDDGHEEENTDTRLKPVGYINEYDNYGNPIELMAATTQNSYQSNLYGYDGLYRVAEVKNAELKDIAYTSFEHADRGNWSYAGNAVFDLNSITGNKMYNIAKGALSKVGLTTTKVYVLTYWTKNSSAYTISGTQGAAIMLGSRNGWQNYQHKITGVASVSISGTGFIDEVRLYPSGASMNTFTYAPFIGITSSTDRSNSTSYSYYDEYNRLQFVRDSKKNIIQANSYNFNSDAINNFNTFTNSARSVTFIKNDCGGGLTGSAVTYNVEAGRYTASTQLAADALAQRDIDQNGQTYANANGTCTTQSIYARVEISNTSGDSGYTDSENYWNSTSGDVYIKLYSNSACTIPLTITAGITAIVTEAYNNDSGWSGSYQSSTDVSYNIPAGNNSYFIGRKLLENIQNYTNPYSGSGSVTDYTSYSYTLKSNGNYYIALPTKP